MINRLDGKAAKVIRAGCSIGKATPKISTTEGVRVVCAACSIQESDHKPFEGLLNTTVTENLIM